MLLTANLFPIMCFSIASVLNTVAISYHSLAAVPFGSIVVVLLIWILVSCPLCLFGTVRAWADCHPAHIRPLSRPAPETMHCEFKSELSYLYVES